MPHISQGEQVTFSVFLLEWSSIPCIHIHGIVCPQPFDSDSATDSYLPSSCYWRPGLIYITGINYKEGLLFSLMLLHLSLWSLRIAWLWLSLYARDQLKTEVRHWFSFEGCSFWLTLRVSDVPPKQWGRTAFIIACSCANKNYWPNGDAKANELLHPVPSPLFDYLQTDPESPVPLCGQTLMCPTPWWLSFGWTSPIFPWWSAAPALLCMCCRWDMGAVYFSTLVWDGYSFYHPAGKQWGLRFGLQVDWRMSQVGILEYFCKATFCPDW